MKKIIAIIVASWSLFTSHPAADAAEVVPKSVRPTVELRMPGDIINGAPLWATVSLHNPSQEAVTGPAKPFFPFVGIGLRLEVVESKTGKAIRENALPVPSHLPITQVDEDGIHHEPSWPTEQIQPGQVARRTFSVADWEEVPPGAYQLVATVILPDGRELARSEPAAVAVRALATDERQVLEALKPFGLFQTNRPATDEQRAKLSPALKQVLEFELLLRELFASDPPLSQIDESRIQVESTRLFDPELAALRYEVLLAKGKKADAEALKAETLKQHPSIRELMQQADRGSGTIKLGRDLRRRVSQQSK